jgi:hypothetical protein
LEWSGEETGGSGLMYGLWAEVLAISEKLKSTLLHIDSRSSSGAWAKTTEAAERDFLSSTEECEGDDEITWEWKSSTREVEFEQQLLSKEQWARELHDNLCEQDHIIIIISILLSFVWPTTTSFDYRHFDITSWMWRKTEYPWRGGRRYWD